MQRTDLVDFKSVLNVLSVNQLCLGVGKDGSECQSVRTKISFFMLSWCIASLLSHLLPFLRFSFSLVLYGQINKSQYRLGKRRGRVQRAGCRSLFCPWPARRSLNTLPGCRPGEGEVLRLWELLALAWLPAPWPGRRQGFLTVCGTEPRAHLLSFGPREVFHFISDIF